MKRATLLFTAVFGGNFLCRVGLFAGPGDRLGNGWLYALGHKRCEPFPRRT